MPKIQVVQVPSPGAAFEVVERDLPEPGAGHVRIKIEACGVCHSDGLTKNGYWPGIAYPRVPGHEVIGRIDALGAGVTGWSEGQRVGVGWFGGACGVCETCRRGDAINCPNLRIPGISYDGGYAEAMIAPIDALVRVPDQLDSIEGAPLLCAGVTTYNALRNSGARPGDRVAILGIGGLGHLGVQFAARMGFETIAVARGASKADLARELGAHHYVDSEAGPIGDALKQLGSVRVIVATVTDAKTMSAAVPGLSIRGKMIVVGVAFEPVEVSTIDLISGCRSIEGSASGTSIDSEDTLAFSQLSGVRPRIETYPLASAADAYARMESGHARFRVVLAIGG